MVFWLLGPLAFAVCVFVFHTESIAYTQFFLRHLALSTYSDFDWFSFLPLLLLLLLCCWWWWWMWTTFLAQFHFFLSLPSAKSTRKRTTIAFSNNKFHNNKHETARIWNVHTLFVWFTLCIATATVTAKPTKGTWKQCEPNPNPKSNSICECRNGEPSKEPNRKSKSIHVTKHSQCTDPNKKQYAKQLNGPIEHIVKWTKCQSILWPCEKRKEPRRKRRKK